MQKEIFIEKFKSKTRTFACDIIKFLEEIPTNNGKRVISYQLIKSSTSVGANYRAMCRARSNAEFFSKCCIVVEEADESLYWLELIEQLKVRCNLNELKRLKMEAESILKVVAAAKNKTYKK